MQFNRGLCIYPETTLYPLRQPTMDREGSDTALSTLHGVFLIHMRGTSFRAYG